MLTSLQRLQQWYIDQCDGDWEHDFGVRIDTLDNPGWRLKINLVGTDLEGQPFSPLEYNLRVEPSADWHRVWVEGGEFHGAGDPGKLEFMLECFLTWAGRPGR